MFGDVKLAWAKGETVQYSDYLGGWTDWCSVSVLDLNMHKEWRVKPDKIIVEQWERKYYLPASKHVHTAVAKNKEDLQSQAIKWINLPEYKTYEVEGK